MYLITHLYITPIQVQCCFTSTETVQTIRDKPYISSFTQLLNSDTYNTRLGVYYYSAGTLHGNRLQSLVTTSMMTYCIPRAHAGNRVNRN